MVPEGWRHGKFRDLIAQLDSGVSVNGENRAMREEEIGVLKVSAVSYGSFDQGQYKTVIKEDKDRARLNPKKGQIIISRSNTEDLVGACAYIEATCPSLFLPDKLWQTVPQPDVELDMKWLAYLLSAPHARHRLSKLATGTSGSMKNITKDELLSLDIEIPPITEQKKIAHILSTWDKAIETVEKLIENSKAQKKALAEQLLTGKRRFREFRKEDSKKYALIDVAVDNRYSFTGGPFGSDLKSVDYANSGVRIIQLQNIGDGSFLDNYKIYTSNKKANELESCNIFPGDIIMSKMGDPVARATIIPNIEYRYLMASDGIRLEVDQNKFDVKFICELINHHDFRRAAIRSSTGSTRRRIGLTELRKLQLKAPCLAEQKKIGQLLQQSDLEIVNLQRQHEFLQQQKKALMQQLLTGKRRVKVDEA